MARKETQVETVIGLVPVYGQYWKYMTTIMGLLTGTGSDPLAQAIQELAKQIAELQARLNRLNERVNELAANAARVENTNRARFLVQHNNAGMRLASRLAELPDNPKERRDIALEAGQLVQLFIDDRDLWNWTDVRTTTEYDDFGVQIGQPEVTVLPPDYKSGMALPVYALALTCWLMAIELECAGDKDLLARRHSGQIGQHLDMVSVSPGFDEFQRAPHSWPEQVKARITCQPIAQTTYAKDGKCVFSIQCDNTMERRRYPVRDIVQAGFEGGQVLCTPDADLGLFDEQAIEDEQGVAAFAALEAMLRQIISTGSLRRPGEFKGRFGTTPFHYRAFIYAVDAVGDLQWYHQKPSPVITELAGWDGPRKVGNGWDGMRTVLPAGGNRLYAVAEDGTLRWYRHDAFNDGVYGWTGGVDVGHRVGIDSTVIGAGDGVLYEIGPDGALYWHFHSGFRDGDGAATWRGPVHIGTDWAQFRQVIAAGDGVLYAIRDDGIMLWYRHVGWQDGTPGWEGPREVGQGWHTFRRVVSIGQGVLYPIRPDGTMLWYQHEGWETGDTFRLEPAPKPKQGQIGGSPVISVSLWHGPIEAGSGWSDYSVVTALLPAKPIGPH